MSKDKNEGKACMVTMNTILLIIAAAVLGMCIFINTGKNIPSILSSVKGYVNILMVCSIGVMVFAIIGYCASCGGCFLFFYTIVITILTIATLLCTIGAFALFFVFKSEKASDKLISTIDKSMKEWVNNPNNTAEWNTFQDNCKCCGYNKEAKTGSVCPAIGANNTVADCRDTIFGAVKNYSLIVAIAMAVVFIVILIINCASCKRMKSDCKN